MKETPNGLFPIIDDLRIKITSGTLHIKNVMISDGGKYQCIITNGIGDKRTDTVLIVTCNAYVFLCFPILLFLNLRKTIRCYKVSRNVILPK